MTAEKTLLQQIREKELLLIIKIEDERREAEELIFNARREAAEIIENSERVEKAAAQEYYEKEMENLRKENEQLRNQGSQKATAVRDEGERRLPSAIEKIVKSVSME